MLLITKQYIPIQSDIAFLRIKQYALAYPYYLTAFYIHVFSSIVLIPLGGLQFFKQIQSTKKWHRLLGLLYVFLIVCLAAPSGFLIGLHANGGFMSILAFCSLSIIWFFSTWKAFSLAKQKQIIKHQQWMIRSYALTLSAITLRFWKQFIVYFFHPKPMDVYQIVAWLAWVLNLFIAEFFIFYYFHKKTKP
ncbi:MAG: DUF2306 domain-containing protein [Chitinophagaceae bacterium]